MSRYSTCRVFKHCKNSLKSVGNRIVSIANLPHQLHRLQSLVRRLRRPISRFIARRIKPCCSKLRFVHPQASYQFHKQIIPANIETVVSVLQAFAGDFALGNLEFALGDFVGIVG